MCPVGGDNLYDLISSTLFDQLVTDLLPSSKPPGIHAQWLEAIKRLASRAISQGLPALS